MLRELVSSERSDHFQMAHITCPVGYLQDQLIDLVGIKAGLAIDRSRFRSLLDNGAKRHREFIEEGSWWVLDPTTHIRMEATAIEKTFILLMNQLGAIRDLSIADLVIMDWIIKNETGELRTAADRALLMMRNQYLTFTLLIQAETPPGLESLAAEVRRRHILHTGMPEIRSWDAIVPLTALFESEEIPDAAGAEHYFDQRFIDYLFTQSSDLERMHWRQFEYLTGEWYRRNGYDVEVTPGRGDRGIDVIAKKAKSQGGPEHIIVQAKRLSGKNTVEINDVKALYFDRVTTGATKAVMVTTTRLAPGGRDICKAHKFGIYAEEKENVVKWLHRMKTEY